MLPQITHIFGIGCSIMTIRSVHVRWHPVPNPNPMLTPLALLLLGASPSPGAALEPLPVVVPLETVAAIESYEDLMKDYAAAKKARRAEIKDAKSPKERKVLRAKPLATEFLSRFQAVGDSGDVRGYLWMLTEARKLGIKKADRASHRLDVYNRIVKAKGDSKGLADALRRIADDKSLEASQRISLLKRVMGRDDVVGEGKCIAQLSVGSLLFDSDVESDKAMGEQILKELVASEACSDFVAAAEKALSGVSLEVGGKAPDFKGTTIDGVTFKLSDYRGKVVLLDFFGFW